MRQPDRVPAACGVFGDVGHDIETIPAEQQSTANRSIHPRSLSSVPRAAAHAPA
jgi:hypothetical protein